jgi:Flp pilus assembly protein TadD
MSLINNMLKDLEKRETFAREVPDITLMNHSSTSAFFIDFKSMKLWSFLFPIIIFSLFLLLHHKKQPNLLAPIIEPKQTTTSSAINPSSEDVNWLKPALITGVTLQVKDNVTEISLLLDHASLYRLNSENIDGQVSFIIEHAQLVAELPSIHHLNSAVERITSQNVSGDTKLTLTLFPGAMIKYVNLNDKQKDPELIIAVEYQKTDSPMQNKQLSNSLKTPAMQNVLAQQYQIALKEAENNQYSVAIDDLASILKMDPSFKEARVSLVALLLDQGFNSKAALLVNEGLTITPDFSPLIELKARILTNEGKIVSALNLLQSASPPMDENPDYHAFIAALYQRNNNNVLAVNVYKQLLAINPHNGSWWFGLGVSLEKLSQEKEAENAYTRAMAEGHLNPESIAYLRNRLQALQGDSNNFYQKT